MRDQTGKFFLWVVKFNSLNELVEYHRTASVSRSQDIKLVDMQPDEVVGCFSLALQHPIHEPNKCFPSFRQYLVQAIYDFCPAEQGELEFRRGDIITVTDRTDQNWWEGEIGPRKGFFPANYATPYRA